MKKLLILLVAAVAIGIVISQLSGDKEDSPGSRPGEDATAEADASDSEKHRASSTDTSDSQDTSSGESNERDSQTDQAEGEKNEDETGQSGKPDSSSDKLRAHAKDLDRVIQLMEENESKESGDKSDQSRDETTSVDKGDMNRAVKLLEEGKRIKARKTLTNIYLNGSKDKQRKAREMLRAINKELVFNPRVLEGAVLHTVQSAETLQKIARQYDVNWRQIKRLNKIDRPDRIRVGQDLKILPGPTRILVRKSEFRLALFIDGHFIKEYPVGLGKNNKTPARTFEISELMIKPDWYPPEGGVIEYGDEDHLIGDRWIGFSDEPAASGFGIHGTNDPDSIGRMVSNGCIRMHNEDVKELYDFVKPGTRVDIKE